MKINKEYQKPEIEVVEMITEGAIVAASEIGERDPGSIGISTNTSFFKNGSILNEE